MWQTIKRLNEERGAFLGQMKSLLKKSEDEKRDLTPDESTQFNDFNTKAEQRKADVERYETARSLEASIAERNGNPEHRLGREDLDTPEQKAEQTKKEQRAAFDKYLRFGKSEMRTEEVRALTVTGAGVVGDRPFYDSLVLGLKWYAGVRQAGATILPTSDGNPLTVPGMNDTTNTGILVGEADDSEDEIDPSVGNVTLSPVKFDSKWIKLSLELIQDAAYPVEATIISMASERIGRAFNTYSTNGTGTGQPEGFITAAGVGKVAAATNAIVYEEIIDFIHSLDAAYRNNPGKCFVQLHDTTLAAIRKLKDGNGRYIWSAGEAGAPSRILDFPLVVNNDMPQLTSGVSSAVMAFGDFSRYFVRDVTTPWLIRADELFISDGLIGYKVFSRHDGQLADSNAVKVLKLAAA
jgi:HK97 family phage major capsid protein